MTKTFKKGDTVKFHLNKIPHFGKIDGVGKEYYIISYKRDYPFSQYVILQENEMELKERQNHPNTTIFK